MTENLARNAGLTFAGGGSPDNTQTPAAPDQQVGEGQQPQGAQQVPQYVTAEQVTQLLRQELDRYRDSITDRTANRVQKILQQAQQKGVQIDPDQARAVLSVLEEEGQSGQQPGARPPAQPQQSPAQPSDQAQPNQAQPGVEGQPVEVHPVILVAESMMQQTGVYIDVEDPELGLIDKETTNPRVFLESIEKAIAAKQLRLQSAGSPARMPTLAAAPKPGNPVANIKDPDELWRLAMQKGR